MADEAAGQARGRGRPKKDKPAVVAGAARGRGRPKKESRPAGSSCDP